MESLEAGDETSEASLSVVEANPQYTFSIRVSLSVDTLRLTQGFEPWAGWRFPTKCKISAKGTIWRWGSIARAGWCFLTRCKISAKIFSLMVLVRTFDAFMDCPVFKVSTMKDCIRVKRIRAYGYIGALPEENILGQWFEVDLTLQMDLSVAGKSDSLADTHNYADIIQQTQTIIQQSQFKLIERLADEIANQALNNDARLEKVTVTVTKLTAPVPNFDGQVAITIERSRF